MIYKIPMTNSHMWPRGIHAIGRSLGEVLNPTFSPLLDIFSALFLQTANLHQP